MQELRSDFYCYAILDVSKPGSYSYLVGKEMTVEFSFEPFYIGKGSGQRDTKHLNASSYQGKTHPKDRKIKKLIESGMRPMVVRIIDNVVEKIAFDTELASIYAIGRRNKKTGPLTNLSEGGEGSGGNSWTDEARKRFSESKKGLPVHPNTVEALRNSASLALGKKRVPSTGEKISLSLKGKKKSPEHAAQIIARNKSRIGVVHSEETKAKMRKAHAARRAAKELNYV